MVSVFKVGGVILTFCNVFVLLTFISFPITAEAFSRGADSSEVGQQPAQLHKAQAHQAKTSHDGKTETQNISAVAVPEPPVLWLMGIGISLFAIFALIKRFRGQDASRDNAK
jgi:hypothetical protein